MIVGLHHAQITIPPGAEARARAFYCDLLGLTELPKPAALAGRGGLWLQVGTAQVHIGVEDGIDRNASKAHVAYEVTDLAAWRVRLQREGIAILDGVPIPNHHRFEIRDPFGNRVELIQRL